MMITQTCNLKIRHEISKFPIVLSIMESVRSTIRYPYSAIYLSIFFLSSLYGDYDSLR